MDVLCYYRNQQRVAIVQLYSDIKIRTLGSDSQNNFVISDSQVAPIHFKIKYQGDAYQIMPVAPMQSEEGCSLRTNAWAKAEPQKKFWIDPEKKISHVVILRDIKVKKVDAPETKAPENSGIEAKTPESQAGNTRGRMKAPESQSPETKPKVPESAETLAKALNGAEGNTKIRAKTPGNALVSEEEAVPQVEHIDHNAFWEDRLATVPRSPAARKTETMAYGIEQIVRPADASTDAKNPTQQETQAEVPQLNLAPDPVLDQDDTVGASDASLFPEGETPSRQGDWIDGRYRIIQTLGQGGMGVVYKVMDQKVKRVVAIKLLLTKDKPTSEANQRFVAEARAMAKLLHKNIVRVYSNGIHEGRPYFTMDFVEGKELQKNLKDLKSRQAMQWMLDICEAVQYFHESGVIHRDLKPSNIMISQYEEPLLMDFGIARDESSRASMTAAGQSIGTPAYMAPEQAKGQIDQIDAKTDVYGLGAIMYEMMTCKPPFSGPPMQVLYKVCHEEPRPILQIAPQVPRDIVTIIEKAMAKERIFRYQSAREMGEDIRRYLDGMCIRAQPPSFAMRFWRKFRRNRALACVLFLLGISLVLLLGSMAYSRHKEGIERRRNIADFLRNASDYLQFAQEEKDKAISHYIQASESYTKVLGLDSGNSKALEGKFHALCEMADYAAGELHDYNFARTIYNSALQMDMDPEGLQRKIENLEDLRQEEERNIQKMVREIFKELSESR